MILFIFGGAYLLGRWLYPKPTAAPQHGNWRYHRRLVA